MCTFWCGGINIRLVFDVHVYMAAGTRKSTCNGLLSRFLTDSGEGVINMRFLHGYFREQFADLPKMP